ncbi:Peptidase M20 domain-containing protein [Lentibacillus sp. JNUCC-1]|uniref:M20 family metallopeptidase n=1 Tax=Lentibacillus sp. JNUCC-1 TaxID=2654513 RepID=UPI0012E8C1BA|nr:M20 family metallopeptidase [Lentibacillus sp. JNUCC-1]MUV37008.1 Peptidase M20 domain-containing protein [Lentibacillus sp. JNUCC-1]
MDTTLTTALKSIEQQLFEIGDTLYENPELGDEEFQSMQLLVDFLKQHHFQVETGIINRPTAFKAVFTSDRPGPTIAFLAEYDALPEVGHGCGHNLIAAMGVGAGVTLSKVVHETGGKVMVIGTPAEETNGAKVAMSEAGVFDDVDVAMMVHGADQSYASGSTSAMEALQFTYTGKASHAAAEPEAGINALDGVIQLFNGINALREHLSSDARLHGIITEGGQAANVVPDRAVAQFYIRAKERTYLDTVIEKVKNIAEGAALMTGASLEVSNYETSFDNLVTNEALSETFTKRLREVSVHPVYPGEQSFGSTDMGDVSKVAPAIHPFIGLNEPGLVFHTKEFADKTVTDDGHRAISEGALSMALTGYDILSDEALFKKIRAEFEASQT